MQLTRNGWFVRGLLGCGLLSSLLYLLTDLVGASSYPDYDYVGQAISEMSAVGAPTADLLAPFYMLYSVLFALFGAGVWFAAGRRRRLRWSAAFMVALSALGIGWALSPMNMRGHEPTLTDMMHLAMGAASTLLILAIIATGAAAFGRAFRIYSAATALVMLVFGYLMSLDVPRVPEGLPTPRLGMNERIMMAAWLLWMVVFSVTLLREKKVAQAP